MCKYVLAYTIVDCAAEGTFVEEFGMDKDKMHEIVNDLANEYKDCFTVQFAGFLQVEYKYVPVEQVTCYKPVEI